MNGILQREIQDIHELDSIQKIPDTPRGVDQASRELCSYKLRCDERFTNALLHAVTFSK